MRLLIRVGSQNPVKVNAAKVTLARYFPEAELDVQGVSVPSEVSDQPMSEQETLLGAKNRVVNLQQQTEADFYVAFEGGVDQFSYGTATFAYVVIQHKNQTAVGRTGDLPIPDVFYQELKAGKELGDVLDDHFQTQNIKQKGGAIALLTEQLETRESTYVQAMTLAMARIVNSSLFTS
ncbi:MULTISPECIES: inosine/xanthosine triphosphatase [Gammaproteobacteria]|uniref:inosine/xanthosine triphosphatase n=1 Tax=Gammaproteobacteria TaxID=1236 RepID=UPI000DD0B0AA|nr:MULTISPECIES: inosine/xanthosine triphosphatase [Gammaproteobacteria]RTE85589.1 non-canonical purine NTP phosphatase [Aliidiomarina sp. B3213]TCZ89559.1 non-canonical purine NTP phosphatase [Lysobacter sp. N42]